jgi:PIN domain nuclease of toxin-antitoxin system
MQRCHVQPDGEMMSPLIRTLSFHTQRAENQLAISAISFWKIALLAAKDRLELHRRPAELRAELLDTGVMELALGCCAGGES